MHSNRLVAALFFALGGAALAITSWIIQRSGTMQAATADGREALGWAAIVVHVGGVVVFGLATGAFIRGRQRIGALLCGLMMLGAAGYSAWQIASFATAELISVTRAREITEQREAERHKAELAAKAERQKTQAKLAEQQLRWLQGTVEETRGRQSRKDYVEAGSKLIAEIGKGEAPAPAPPEPKAEPVAVRTDALAEWLANAVGWRQTTLQASPTLWLALMLILIEIVSWPLASFFWRRPINIITEIGPAPAAPAPRVPPAPQPAALDVTEPVKRLPAPVATQSADGGQGRDASSRPERMHPSRAPAPVRIERRPVDQWAEAALKLIDFPVYQPGKRVGPLRGKQDPKTTARRLALWMQAVGLTGSYSSTEIATYYREFAEWDHREAIPYNNLAAVLPKAPGVSKTNATLDDGSRGLRWVIAQRKFRPAKKDPGEERAQSAQTAQPAQDDAPAPEGRRVLPFGVAQRPVAAPMRHLMPPPSRDDLAWLRAQEKAMRALRIARNRKQRGSITMRARAA